VGIAVLGPLTLQGGQGELHAVGPRDRVVLAALVARPGEVVSAEGLADALWGEQVPASGPKIVQGCVMRLRKLLGAQAIETSLAGYRLAVPSDEIDARRFERAVGRARDLLAAEDPERAALLLADALTMWRGEPLSDVDGWDPGRIEAARLTELRHEAEELYVESALRAGQHDRVLAKAQVLVAEAPLRERRWILLATAQYQDGRQGEALRTIHRLRTVLNDQLGLDPSPEIGALEQAILQQHPSLVAASALPEPSSVCPYPGLRPYDIDDADGFFGRDADVAACLRRLAETSVLAVVGPSGCGKSSLVRAGVAAALRTDGRRVVVMTPGAHPVAARVAAMPGPASTPPVLVVDQFEEAFTLCSDQAEQEAFLSALTAHAAVAPLVVAVRADRIADLSAHPEFARTVEPGLYLLGAMTEADLRAAIEQPARLASLVVEPGLVDLLVGEVSDQPGALPLLSHALAETWRRREGRTLTVAGYTFSGGIRGAVAQTAEQVYDRLATGQRSVLRDLLLRLVVPGPEGDPVRSRLPRRLVVTGPDNDAMIDLLVGARLVTSDDGVVEIAHESLARAWPRLRDWLDDDLEGQRTLHHLATAADTWDDLGRPDSELYRGLRLAKALDWQHSSRPALTATEEEFLAQSKQLSEAELRAAEDAARHQTRVNRRLRAALGAAALLLVGALIAGLVAVQQAGRADEAATGELARRIGARALLTENISQSILLAAHGVRLDDSPEQRANLVAAMNKRPFLVRSMPAPSGRTETVDVSSDGRRLVSGDDNGTFHLYDAASGRVLDSYDFGRLPDPERTYTDARFSPDGRTIVAMATSASGAPVDTQRPLRLLSADTLDPLSQQPGFQWSVHLYFTGLAFSADGRYLAAAVIDEAPEKASYALVWDLQRLPQGPERVPLSPNGQRISLSPDGHTLYSSWPLTASDVATGRQKWQRREISGFEMDISPSGDLVAAQQYSNGYLNADAQLVDTSTGRTVRTLGKPADVVRSLAFSTDGTLLATGAYFGKATVWDVATGRPRDQIATSEVTWGVGFGPDGRTLYTGGDDGVLRAYDLSGRQRFLRRTQTAPSRPYLYVLPTENGTKTAYLWRQGKESWVSITDASTGTTTAPARLGAVLSQSPWIPAAWHPDGHRLVVHDTRAFTVIDADSGKVLEVKEPGALHIGSIAYVDHGRRIAVGALDRIAFYDADTLDVEGRTVWWPAQCCAAPSPDGETAVFFEESPDAASQHWRTIHLPETRVVAEGDLPMSVTHAAYSPDGRLLAVTGASGEVFTIDAETGTVRRTPTPGHNAEGRFVRFSPDGSRILSGAADGTVSLWDTHSLASLGAVSTGSAVPVTTSWSGDVAVITAHDGSTYRWDTDLEHTMAQACTMAGRNLTPDEWTQAFGDRPYEKTCP
jgi:WD40 repeat protein/DNA-binding SARP family transcriptional activator/energy-coupling factor transporter ATP-binding protein EcfA2